MKYDEFVGQVQQRAKLGTTGEAVTAVRATLETLGERLVGGEADHLAAQLPQEIGHYLRAADTQGERFGLDEFYERVSQRGNADLPDAVYQARVVIEVLEEATARSNQMDHVRAQLPGEFTPLFEAGSSGRMDRRN